MVNDKEVVSPPEKKKRKSASSHDAKEAPHMEMNIDHIVRHKEEEEEEEEVVFKLLCR